MSHYWEVIMPVALAAMGGVVVLARKLRHPPGGHRADHARLTLDVREATVPVAEVAGLPPWAAPPWAAPEADRYSGMGWVSGSSGTDYGHAWNLPPDLEATLRRELHHVDGIEPADPRDLGPGAGFDSAGYNSHLPSGEDPVKVDSPAPDASPREDGAGDESEACGPPAPPAPLWEYRAQNPGLAGEVIQLPRQAPAVTLALAHADAFMVLMREDHARWLASARERWAAA